MSSITSKCFTIQNADMATLISWLPQSLNGGISRGSKISRLAGSIQSLIDPEEILSTLNDTSADRSLTTQSPDDRLSASLQEIRSSAERELLDLVSNVSPTFFETIVLDLLHKMGYGANRADLQRVGGSGDAGIDGVISLDKLGLEKIYVQAKRWQGTVCRLVEFSCLAHCAGRPDGGGARLGTHGSHSNRI